MERPKHLKKFKVIGVLGIITGVVGAIIAFTNFGSFNVAMFMLGGFLCCFGFFIGFSCLMIGFRPEVSKMAIKSAKYIQNENKDDLKDMASTTADIASDAITKTTKAFKNGLFEDTMYCKYCGALIDADSRFCNKCGKEQ